MPIDFPWGVFIILCCGLSFTIYVIYYILRMANEEMQNEQVPKQKIEQRSETIETKPGERDGQES